MKLQVLISTINNNINQLDEKTRDYHDLVVLNQKPNNLNSKIEKTEVDNIQWINLDQKGLSKSRNYAIDFTKADLVYLTDDDIVLLPDFEEVVTRAFIENPECDILAFNIKGIEEQFKKEVTQEKKINYLTSMKLSSVQIVFKNSFLKENKLRFDELFGAGAKYQMGEENIILFDALKKGAKIKFIPETIANLHIGDSTWFEGINEKYLFDKGASFWRMFGFLAPFYSLTYCMRKINEYKENIGFIGAYRATLRGIRDYRKRVA